MERKITEERRNEQILFGLMAIVLSVFTIFYMHILIHKTSSLLELLILAMILAVIGILLVGALATDTNFLN